LGQTDIGGFGTSPKYDFLFFPFSLFHMSFFSFKLPNAVMSRSNLRGMLEEAANHFVSAFG
jgi:hypothetical protein